MYEQVNVYNNIITRVRDLRYNMLTINHARRGTNEYLLISLN